MATELKKNPTAIEGAFWMETAPFQDGRGAFEVFWEASSMAPAFAFQPTGAYHSYNPQPGTLRGMHYQRAPHAQNKLVSCVSGAVRDVIVDLRPESPSYLRWDALELTAASGICVFVPKGCAHGFLTLAEHSTVAYLIDGTYTPEAGAIFRWNDPLADIRWGTDAPILSVRDRDAPDHAA